MFSFACRHKTLSEVKEDGRQYCIICNKAFVPDCAHSWELFGKDKQKCLRCGELRFLQETECVHKWGKTDQRSIIAMNGNIQAVIDILTCEKCGEMKEFRTAAVQR